MNSPFCALPSRAGWVGGEVILPLYLSLIKSMPFYAFDTRFRQSRIAQAGVGGLYVVTAPFLQRRKVYKAGRSWNLGKRMMQYRQQFSPESPIKVIALISVPPTPRNEQLLLQAFGPFIQHDWDSDHLTEWMKGPSVTEIERTCEETFPEAVIYTKIGDFDGQTDPSDLSGREFLVGGVPVPINVKAVDFNVIWKQSNTSLIVFPAEEHAFFYAGPHRLYIVEVASVRGTRGYWRYLKTQTRRLKGNERRRKRLRREEETGGETTT